MSDFVYVVSFSAFILEKLLFVLIHLLRYFLRMLSSLPSSQILRGVHHDYSLLLLDQILVEHRETFILVAQRNLNDSVQRVALVLVLEYMLLQLF